MSDGTQAWGSRGPEWALFAAALLAANLPLLGGFPAEALVFFPESVRAGEWWRLLTFPWVHVSWYHLLLDGAAFLLLYRGLREESPAARFAIMAGAAAGSLAAALTLAPRVASVGLCGLSGIDHGLMAVSAIECLRSRERDLRLQGALLLGAVLLKALVEAATGRVFFEFLHFGLLGVPLAACHLGGILGAVAALAMVQACRAAWAGVPLRDARAG